MVIEIKDDFDLKKIMISGQCFRVKEVSEGVFRFITGDHVLYIRKAENKEHSYEISCSGDEWENTWENYFDMERSYADIATSEYGKHDFSDRSIDFGRGLRILKQDKWEMLISFIISQRKSIPAISSAVEGLSEKFGKNINVSSKTKDEISKWGVDDKDLYSFPTAEELSKATLEDLKSCGLGYRAPYIEDAVKKVISGELDLEEIDSLPDEELFEKLMEVHGVGKKVANCVLLFGYSRTARVPIDVWISRAIDEEFGGENLFPLFGENGGIIQQYIFYYEKNFPKIGE